MLLHDGETKGVFSGAAICFPLLSIQIPEILEGEFMFRILFFVFTVSCMTVLAEEKNLIPDPELKNPSKWYLTKGYRILPESGRERNHALYIERADKNQYSLGGISIPLETLDKNSEYEFGGQVRSEPFGNGTPAQGSLVVQFFKQKKYLTEVWVHSPPAVNDWVGLSGTFTIPADADRVVFLPLLRRYTTGKVWFSNLYVRQKKLAFFASILLPHQPQALTEGKHRFVLGCHVLSLPSQYKGERLFAMVELKKDGCVVQKEILPIRNERDCRKSKLSGAIKSFVPSPVCGMSFHEKRNGSRFPGCIWL